ncbi:MAG: CDC27 family protein, partial [bacterium]
MTNKNNNPFRERFTEIGKGLKHEKPERAVLPSTEGLRLDTSFDISQFEGFAEPQAEIEGVADKVKPTGMGDLRIDADLGKLDEGIQKIKKQKIKEEIRRWIEEAQKLIVKKQFRRAITPLDKALEAEPTSVEALYLKGYCFFGLKNYDTALNILNDARKYGRDREIIVLILVLQAACTRAIIEA